jgi:hypothetical protein
VRRIYSLLTLGHRSALLIATATMSVGASLVASNARNVQHWLLLIGGCMLLVTADLLSEVERSARDLAASTNHDIRKTRADIFASRHPTRLLIVTIIAIALVVAAYSWPFWAAVCSAATRQTGSPSQPTPVIKRVVPAR